eukprot:gene557-952_t
MANIPWTYASLLSEGMQLQTRGFCDSERRVTTMLKHHLVMQHVTSMAELMDAAIVSSGEDVMRLIRLGIDINTQNYDGQTVLHIAAAHGNIAVVQMLVEQGIDLNLRDRWGHTALQEALRRDELSTVRFLDKKGSKMYVDDAAAALCNAASQGNPDEVAVLLKNGVSVNGADYDLRTALHVACSKTLEASFSAVGHHREPCTVHCGRCVHRW